MLGPRLAQKLSALAGLTLDDTSSTRLEQLLMVQQDLLSLTFLMVCQVTRFLLNVLISLGFLVLSILVVMMQ